MEDSPLAQLADTVIPLHAGPERSVAATKSYLSSLSAILQLAAHWKNEKPLLDALTIRRRKGSFAGLVVAIAAFVAMQRFKVGLMPVIGACAVLGLVWRWACFACLAQIQ